MTDTDSSTALDRPVWSALDATHRRLALGGRLARRYPADIAPFAALADDSPMAIAELSVLLEQGPVALVTPTPVTPIDGVETRFVAACRQMVGPAAPSGNALSSFATLGASDVPAMLALTALTKPGPFYPRTHELGRYIGIRDGDRLAAMAGERMRFDGFTEISAVCVHPDYRGRGYARQLIVALMNSIAARGERSFLHVFDDNRNAISLYEQLGFATRAELNITRLTPLSTALG